MKDFDELSRNAVGLFMGHWRSSDKDFMKEKFDLFSDDDIDFTIYVLKFLEQAEKKYKKINKGVKYEIL